MQLSEVFQHWIETSNFTSGSIRKHIWIDINCWKIWEKKFWEETFRVGTKISEPLNRLLSASPLRTRLLSAVEWGRPRQANHVCGFLHSKKCRRVKAQEFSITWNSEPKGQSIKEITIMAQDGTGVVPSGCPVGQISLYRAGNLTVCRHYYCYFRLYHNRENSEH